MKEKFEEKGVLNWRPQPSEVCAGGVEREDICQGEGGAPLVCYDDSSDQYFLVGLVGYGFECNTTLPGVYTNIADPVVRDFIDDAIDNEDFCVNRESLYNIFREPWARDELPWTEE